MDSLLLEHVIEADWISTRISPDAFNLKSTLNSGQSFRWKEIPNSQEFVGVIDGRVWRLRQLTLDDPVAFHATCATRSELEVLQSMGKLPQPLVSYFRLNTSVDHLFTNWLNQDILLREFFLSSTPSQDLIRFKGLRLLHQDPRETIFAFITSANNNVARISSLLTKLSERYGKKLWSNGTISVRSFPTLEALSHPKLESELRIMGFGYRAKFIPAAVKKLNMAGGDEFLETLRESPYEECKRFLLQLPGVGNKVADCICLSCLGKLEVVPVDIHILRAAALRGIHPPNSSSSLTETAYRYISQRLSQLWHPYAGWAQVIVFSIHLHRQSSGAKQLKATSVRKIKSSAKVRKEEESKLENPVLTVSQLKKSKFE
ncbi:hypothetical protein Aperf_G00000062761 [Anoplocephala perfoliata]